MPEKISIAPRGHANLLWPLPILTDNDFNWTSRPFIGAGETAHASHFHRRTELSKYIMDPRKGSSVKIGTIQRRLAWPLRKDDTHKSRSVKIIHV